MPDKKPRRSGAKLDDCHESLPPPSSPAENHTMAQHRRQAEETPSRAVGFCVGTPTHHRLPTAREDSRAAWPSAHAITEIRPARAEQPWSGPALVAVGGLLLSSFGET